MTFIFYTAIFLFLILSVLLSIVILVQESKSMGLGASFGGDAGESLFGTSTAQVLKKFTAYLGITFMLGCVLLSIWTGAMGRRKQAPPVQIEQMEE